MVKKVKLINLPTDLSTLRSLLKDFKNKEIKLEADLCIRENPSLEDCIIKIMLCIADITEIQSSLKILSRKGEVSKQKIESANKMIAFFHRKIDMLLTSTSDRKDKLIKFYTEKIEVYEDSLKMLDKGYTGEYLEVNEKKMESIIILKREVRLAQKVMQDLDVFDVIPMLEDYHEYLIPEKIDESEN